MSRFRIESSPPLRLGGTSWPCVPPTAGSVACLAVPSQLLPCFAQFHCSTFKQRPGYPIKPGGGSTATASAPSPSRKSVRIAWFSSVRTTSYFLAHCSLICAHTHVRVYADDVAHKEIPSLYSAAVLRGSHHSEAVLQIVLSVPAAALVRFYGVFLATSP